VARTAVAINEAQRMRGSGGTRRRDWQAAAAPIVLSALDDSLQLAEAMEARGFGSGPRTRYVTAHLDPASVVGMAGAAAAVVLTIAARVTGQLPDWYPFPSASLPDVSILPVIACLLLALPLVTWRPW
jgi:energy-coupling factor transport system permease protein